MNELKFFVCRNVWGKNPRPLPQKVALGVIVFLSPVHLACPEGRQMVNTNFCMKMLTWSRAWKEVSGTAPSWEISWSESGELKAKTPRVSLRQVCIRREKRRKERDLEWDDPSKGLGLLFKSARPVPDSGKNKKHSKISALLVLSW